MITSYSVFVIMMTTITSFTLTFLLLTTQIAFAFFFSTRTPEKLSRHLSFMDYVNHVEKRFPNLTLYTQFEIAADVMEVQFKHELELQKEKLEHQLELQKEKFEHKLKLELSLQHERDQLNLNLQSNYYLKTISSLTQRNKNFSLQ